MKLKGVDEKMKVFTLNNGLEIPVIGVGTAPIIGNKISIISQSLKQFNIGLQAPTLGCTLFDTSAAYNFSERILGYSLKLKKRSKLFIITKLCNRDQRDGDVRKALLESMKKLQTDYIDLYLMHWPNPGTYLDCWKQMEGLYKEGLARAIGVCNFHEHHLEKLLSAGTIVPAINQFERHPLLSQKPLIKYCENVGIKVMAYTPIGRMHEKLKNNGILIRLSKKYNKTIAQIILRWHYQQSIITIPRTTKTKRIRENINIFDFSFSNEEIESIDSINENLRLRYDPDNCDFTKL